MVDSIVGKKGLTLESKTIMRYMCNTLATRKMTLQWAFWMSEL